MELRQLEQFVAVAEERHFTRAAARVHVVQSTLSAAIAALERELGEKLFVRNNRHVTLTPAGTALLPAARWTLTAAEAARNAVTDLRGTMRGRLRIGAIRALGHIDLPSAVVALRRRHPAVTVELTRGVTPALTRALGEGRLDVVFVDGPVSPQMSSAELDGDELVVAVSATDPLAERETITLADPALAEREFLACNSDTTLESQISAACLAAGLTRTIVCHVDDLGQVVELVREGAGLAVMPRAVVSGATPGVRSIPITPTLHRRIYAVWPGTRPPTGAAEALLRLIVPRPRHIAPSVAAKNIRNHEHHRRPAGSAALLAPNQ